MASTTRSRIVPAGRDLLNEQRKLGLNTIDFKLTADQTHDLFVVEITCKEPGGPPRHLHADQDEYFYVLEGEFILEIGGEPLTPRPGDSMLGPRRVVHSWARVGEARGRLLIAFSPAGKMEAFFRETAGGTIPRQGSDVWRRHGMEAVGPPLIVE
jgi:quercetin dioxygenase-like cupin family protein